MATQPFNVPRQMTHDAADSLGCYARRRLDYGAHLVSTERLEDSLVQLHDRVNNVRS